MAAAADCERIIGGFLGQPVNALTTLGFVVAGIVVLRLRRDRVWIGLGLVATGVGSLLFHGPMPSWAQWAHDVSLAWLILLVAGSATAWQRLSTWPGLAVLAGGFAVGPDLADPIAVALTGVAIWLLARDRGTATWGPVALLGVSAVVGRLAATGWPLCDPDSLLQPHGLWHLGAALAVAWWAVASPSLDRRADTPFPVPSR